MIYSAEDLKHKDYTLEMKHDDSTPACSSLLKQCDAGCGSNFAAKPQPETPLTGMLTVWASAWPEDLPVRWYPSCRCDREALRSH